MDVSNYTPAQVLASLKAQGMSDRQAREMMKTMGPMKTPTEQGSNVLPNMSEGIAGAAAQALLNGTKLGTFAKLAGTGVAGNIGNIVGADLSGTNYYDQASPQQIIADIGGSLAGGWLGGHVGSGIQKGGAAAKKTGAKLAARTAGKLAPAVLGRTLGGALGSFLPGAGTVAGATIGGYLLPKLFANNEEKALDPNAGVNDSTVAALAAAGLIMSPAGKQIRNVFKGGAKKADDYLAKEGVDGLPLPGTRPSERVADATQDIRNAANEKLAEPTALLNDKIVEVAGNPNVSKISRIYGNALTPRQQERWQNIHAREPVDPKDWLGGTKTTLQETKDNVGFTMDRIGAFGDTIEEATRRMYLGNALKNQRKLVSAANG